MTRRGVTLLSQCAAGLVLTVIASLSVDVVAAPDDPILPAEVGVFKQGHGWLLTDRHGMTLYTFARDQEPGKSSCAGACAEQWPPLAAPPESKPPSPEWSTIKRQDGSLQWVFRSHPLYRYARDTSPRDTYGDGVTPQWAVALRPIATPPGISTKETLLGYVLTDLHGMTLYVSDKDKGDTSACDTACAHTWTPIEMPWMASPIDADWTGVTRNDGTQQWAYKGHPLYTYAGDVASGETSGHVVNRSWHAMVLQPPPPLPDWVTLQESDAGPLYATAAGQTVYQHDVGTSPHAKEIERPQDWNPVLARPDAKPVGNWAIITNNEGQPQWAYKGLLLFTNDLDTTPGDLHGIRSTDRTWHTIMQNGKPMQGTGA